MDSEEKKTCIYCRYFNPFKGAEIQVSKDMKTRFRAFCEEHNETTFADESCFDFKTSKRK